MHHGSTRRLTLPSEQPNNNDPLPFPNCPPPLWGDIFDIVIDMPQHSAHLLLRNKAQAAGS